MSVSRLLTLGVCALAGVLAFPGCSNSVLPLRGKVSAPVSPPIPQNDSSEEDRKVDPVDLRRLLREVIENDRIRAESGAVDRRLKPWRATHLEPILKAFLSYRTHRSDRPQKPEDTSSGIEMSIRDAPFPSFLIYALMNPTQPGEKTLWEQIGERTYQDNIRLVDEPTDVELMDYFMLAILEGAHLSDQFPKSLRPAAKAIGRERAEKVRRAGMPDENGVIQCDAELGLAIKVSIFDKLVKLLFKVASDCEMRQIVFKMFHDAVEKERRQTEKWERETWPAVHAILMERFIETFNYELPHGFFEVLSEFNGHIADFVTEKFVFKNLNLPPSELAKQDYLKFVEPRVAEMAALWRDAPLLERIEPGTAPEGFVRMRFSELIAGLRSDLAVAKLMSRGGDPAAAAVAAPLFYASANRFLVMLGSEQVLFHPRTLNTAGRIIVKNLAEFPVLGADKKYQPAYKERIDHVLTPVFESRLFGGWGLQAGETDFSPWGTDFENYVPEDPDAPSPIRIFPSEFLMTGGARPVAEPGTVYFETLDDMSDLVMGVAEFAEATKADGVFGGHFGSQENFQKAVLGFLDKKDKKNEQGPASIVVFPDMARQLPYGMLAVALKNLIAPKGGHLAGRRGFNLLVREKITAEGRLEEMARVRSLAKFLLAVVRLKKVMQADDNADPKLKAVLSEYVKDFLEFGGATLGAMGQDVYSGGFLRRLQDVPTGTPSDLLDTILALRALTEAHKEMGITLYHPYLFRGWQYLDGQWGTVMDSAQPWIRRATLQTELMNLLDSSEPIWGGLVQYAENMQGAEKIGQARWRARYGSLRAALAETLEKQAP
ncbi:MAG: hypothetical protein AB7P04_13600 [Bacteriovoracia bacterium]